MKRKKDLSNNTGNPPPDQAHAENQSTRGLRKWKSAAAQWFYNLSLNGKIILLVILVGFLPLGIVLTLSLSELKHQSEERQMYALNQGYSQMKQAVEDKLSRVHNISTLLAVNDMVNLNLKMSGEDGSMADQLANFENISAYAYSMEMTFESNNIIFYINDDFPVVNNQSRRYRSLESAQEADWYGRLEENNGRPTWVSFDSYVAITRKLWDPDDYNKAIGVLAVSFDRQYLEDLLIGSVQNQIIYLRTAGGDILAGNLGQEELADLTDELILTEDREFYSRKIGSETYMVRSNFLEKSNLYLVSLVPVRVMEQEADAVNSRMRMIFIIICAVVVLAFVPLTKSVTSRIQLLKEQMIRVQDGVIKKIDVDREYRDEIGQLITHYNVMADKVEELMEEQYALGQEKTGAELKALQSQINPHFLYNTLDMINWMAQKNESENIRSVVQAMSRFYRLTLSKGADVVTIADEVKMCDAFMEIQKRRYKGRILYEAEVEEDIMPYLIPKITLQPFLENAIIHGINEKEDARGVVMLSGWMEDGRITLSVTDDGTGMTEQDKKKSSSGSHYGMENIGRRLKLFYGEDIPVQVESSPGIGTCIIINIPIRSGNPVCGGNSVPGGNPATGGESAAVRNPVADREEKTGGTDG